MFPSACIESIFSYRSLLYDMEARRDALSQESLDYPDPYEPMTFLYMVLAEVAVTQFCRIQVMFLDVLDGSALMVTSSISSSVMPS